MMALIKMSATSFSPKAAEDIKGWFHSWLTDYLVYCETRDTSGCNYVHTFRIKPVTDCGVILTITFPLLVDTYGALKLKALITSCIPHGAFKKRQGPFSGIVNI
jgi:hypothetical protein